jgi:hypothetical protein
MYRFQEIILNCLPSEWVCTVLTFHYGLKKNNKRRAIDERVVSLFWQYILF